MKIREYQAYAIMGLILMGLGLLYDVLSLEKASILVSLGACLFGVSAIVYAQYRYQNLLKTFDEAIKEIEQAIKAIQKKKE